MTERRPEDLPARSSVPTTEKFVVTIRMPSDLGRWMMREAEKRGWSLNEYFVTIAHDYYSWFGLPDMVIGLLREDEVATSGLDRRRYIQHVLMRRYHEVYEKGPGFDRKPTARGDRPNKK
jgi:hypothetical protein